MNRRWRWRRARTGWTWCAGSSPKRRQHLNPGGLLVCEIGGNRRALERAYPRLEFAWPETSDPGTVFILRREQLPARANTG